MRNVLEVPVLRLDGEMPLPAPAREGDAGFDLRSRVELALDPGGGRALVPTGIALELPEGTAGLILPRSGLALRHGVSCLNAPGLIDAGYRGEIGVILVNTDPTEPFTVSRGDRIAQLVVVQLPALSFLPVSVLSESERGAGGFGHTGLG